MDLSAAGAAVSLPPPRSGDWQRLSGTPHGTLYRRRLVDLGSYQHPATGSELRVNLSMLDFLQFNFAARTTGYVPVQSRNNDDPNACVGEVVALETTATGLDVLCDVRAAGPPSGAVSASVALDYSSNRGRRVGPSLLRVVLLDRDFRRELDEVAAAPSKRFAAPATDTTFAGLAVGALSRSSRVASPALSSPAASPPGIGGALDEGNQHMSEYGPVRTSYEIDRLTELASEMGLVRTPAFDGSPSSTAPGNADREVARYVEMAEDLGLATTRSRPSSER
jgi:hypothetical protein